MQADGVPDHAATRMVERVDGMRIAAGILWCTVLLGCATSPGFVPGSSMMNGLYDDRAARRALDTIEGYLAKADGTCPVAMTEVVEPPRSVDVDFAKEATATEWIERWRVDCAERSWTCDLGIAAKKAWSSSSPSDVGVQVIRCAEVAADADDAEGASSNDGQRIWNWI